jgi:hypothetical protein
MKRVKKFPREALTKGIEWARQLVEGHRDPLVPAGVRLREIGSKLRVSRIEPGAVRTAGFLKRLPDRSFAIYYANDCSLARRRFTVAHELGHLVLERFHRHIAREKTIVCEPDYYRERESAVDRIAAELLMPEALVTGLIKTCCQLERERSTSGVVQKLVVLREVGEMLGVSERALVHRLLELRDLLCVLLRVQWHRGRPERARHLPVKVSRERMLRILDGMHADPANLLKDDGWEHNVRIQTGYSQRVMHCNAWRRPAMCPENGQVETWIVGWGWTTLPLGSWDDSEHWHGGA